MVDDIASIRLTAKKTEFSEWYGQALGLADILDQRYELKGMFVWRPYGYRAMMNLKRVWDGLFQGAGIQECYFPLIIPLEYCKINESWWEKFSTEGYKVIAGKDDKVQGALRPTGEPAMYPMFSLWVRSTADLPIRIYETTSSFRYETKNPRPLIRDMEITVWHEIHTAHATSTEADAEMRLHMELWDEIWKVLCLPVWKVKKPVWECFPGAIGGIEYYNTMPTAKVLESGSVNNLGQAYAKEFNIQYADGQGEKQHVWQVCTGVGARLLAATLAIHGDDRGFIMPPKIAPHQVVIVPIIYQGQENAVLENAKALQKRIQGRFNTHLDERAESAGRKFYDWEIRGVPLRIELGPRDIQNGQATIVRRDTYERRAVPIEMVSEEIESALAAIEQTLLDRATNMLQDQMEVVNSAEEAIAALERRRICVARWCGSRECFLVANEFGPGIEALGSTLEPSSGTCFHCARPSKESLYIAKTY